MFRHLLVPLDGSQLAEAALAPASALAARFDSEITLLQVVPAPHASTGTRGTPLAELLSDLRSQAYQEVQRYLKARQAILRRQGHIVHRHVTGGDSIAEIILEVASGQGIDGIVMSTHGRGGLSRWVYGSVADKVLRHARVPVLLIQAQAEPPHRLPSKFKHLLVPLDGSELAEKALPVAQQLALQFDGQITLLRVTGAPYVPVGGVAYGDLVIQLRDQIQEEASVYLTSQARDLRQQGCNVDECVIEGEPVADLILNSIDDLGADTIVMSTHGRGGIARWVYGSVADKVLRRARVPLFLIRAAETLETKDHRTGQSARLSV